MNLEIEMALIILFIAAAPELHPYFLVGIQNFLLTLISGIEIVFIPLSISAIILGFAYCFQSKWLCIPALITLHIININCDRKAQRNNKHTSKPKTDSKDKAA